MSKIADLRDDDLVALATWKEYGRILQYYRIKAGWKAQELIQLYGEAIRGEDEEHAMHPSWIYRMEHKNMVPIDPRRREILACILDIPLAYFGLEAAVNASPITQHIFKFESVDTAEYHRALKRYTWGYHDQSAFGALADIQKRITNLYASYPHQIGKEKKRQLALLCGYMILSGDLVSNQKEFDLAIDFFTRAASLAQEAQLHDLQAVALKQMGMNYRRRIEITAGLQDSTAAQTNLRKSLICYERAQTLKNHIQPLYRGLIASGAGIALAQNATDVREFRAALVQLDEASEYTDMQPAEMGIPTAARFDPELYLQDRATALLVSPIASPQHAKLALSLFEEAEKKTCGSKSRRAYRASLEARAFLQTGQYEMATAYAEHALDLEEVKTVPGYLGRIEGTYRQLRASPYGKSTDVARLGLALLRAQRPELFAG